MVVHKDRLHDFQGSNNVCPDTRDRSLPSMQPKQFVNPMEPNRVKELESLSLFHSRFNRTRPDYVSAFCHANEVSRRTLSRAASRLTILLSTFFVVLSSLCCLSARRVVFVNVCDFSCRLVSHYCIRQRFS